ncbi:FAD-dependent monooxygenase [Streptomyces sp. NBC_00536]|uniref:FAD-dependent oxidoreductase n=1 Tax=Streptomyces sp. NBC_00536 TaxID=2975769 RepID=UPI002E8216A0|nr:FAD-dependent oxidoreductase [Streptomyces sp. NBC_00536]WUC82508.1 FAD-dependent monooxygenase [Streptomyces sp. NBC_00536]
MADTADAADAVDVLIVGSGPTGLTLACDLVRRGARVRVIDRRSTPHRESRGKSLHLGSLEIFETLGVADRMTSTGGTGLVFRKYFDGEHINDTPRDGSSVFIGQWQIEEILRDRLAESGVLVEYDAEVEAVGQDAAGAWATLTDGRTLRAAYLAGCDGGGSTVRKMLGIRFDGRTDDEQAMVIGDVTAAGLSRDHWHQWFTSDGGAMMLCPIPGTEVFQLQASPETDHRGERVAPSLESFQRLFDRHARMPGIRLAEVTWASAWRVNVRMADRMRQGRCFLAGDAAHVHPIAGGLGMNTGIQDAATLARVLGAALADPGAEHILETYEAERLPAAAHLLADTSARQARVLAAVREPGRGIEAGLD